MPPLLIAHDGIGIWSWASNDKDVEPDVVMACAGDVPTLETLAAVDLLRQHFPDLKIRVVNVVDLMTLQPQSEHPHGLSDPRIRFHLHHQQTGDFCVSRISVAYSSSVVPSDTVTRTSTFAAIRKREQPPRRST